jgi:two-component system, LytTR family, sensor kinase
MQQQITMAALLTTIFDREKEKLLFWASNIPACILFNWLVFGNHYFAGWRLFITANLLIFPLTIILHNTLTAVNRFIRNRLPLYTDTPKRIFLSLLAYIITTAAFILISVLLYQAVPVLRFEITYQLIQKVLLLGIIANLVIGSSYEVLYTFEKLKETLVENESLKKEQLQQQFDNLKTKVNPHFLFNSLSSLSMLVSEDTEKADVFLNEMSRVYRYMLKTNHHDWAELQQELSFINSYFYLLKVRYGKAVSLQIKADEKYNNFLLPPLTLNLLLENALQHNVAMKEAPLNVTIETNGNNAITVKNNLQRKKMILPTAGRGLETLRAKCSLPGFAVNETDNEFMVIIPLQFSVETQIAKA